MKRLSAFATDRLTVQERWLVLAFLGIVVVGSFMKYARARPVPIPAAAVPPATAAPGPATANR